MLFYCCDECLCQTKKRRHFINNFTFSMCYSYDYCEHTICFLWHNQTDFFFFCNFQEISVWITEGRRENNRINWFGKVSIFVHSFNSLSSYHLRLSRKLPCFVLLKTLHSTNFFCLVLFIIWNIFHSDFWWIEWWIEITIKWNDFVRIQYLIFNRCVI